jgi:DNA invertase Pin-like site-specific DNA recombinase
MIVGYARTSTREQSAGFEAQLTTLGVIAHPASGSFLLTTG